MPLASAELCLILLYAQRYAMGRSTHAAGDVSEAIHACWDDLDVTARVSLLRELRSSLEYEKMNGFVWYPMDLRTWNDLEKWMTKKLAEGG